MPPTLASVIGIGATHPPLRTGTVGTNSRTCWNV